MGNVKVWDSNTGTQISSFHAHGADVLCLAVSPVSRCLFRPTSERRVCRSFSFFFEADALSLPFPSGPPIDLHLRNRSKNRPILPRSRPFLPPLLHLQILNHPQMDPIHLSTSPHSRSPLPRHLPSFLPRPFSHHLHRLANSSHPRLRRSRHLHRNDSLLNTWIEERWLAQPSRFPFLQRSEFVVVDDLGRGVLQEDGWVEWSGCGDD